jgi:two-component system phosphate regulon sensor histidine kinase PhoR
VSRSPRRIYLYWLLLLVPTLAVGAGAIALLRREQARLETDSRSARATHLAAVTERTRLVAENADLLTGDVRNGMVAALREVLSSELRDFLTRWPADNPLVQQGFALSAYGNLIFPEPASDAGRKFRQSYSTLLDKERPWGDNAPAYGANGGNALAINGQPGPASSQAQSTGNGSAQQFGQNQIAAGQNSYPNLAANNSNANSYQSARTSVQAMTKSGTLAQQVALSERSGWVTRGGTAGSPLSLLVWMRRTGGDEVRGAEINVDQLVAQLAAALPSNIETGDGYALRDAQGRVLCQRGTIASGREPDTRTPLASDLLPGWEAVGYSADASSATSSNRGFVATGSLLVGLAVAAILGSGSLLLWQAQSSAEEARQKTSFVANVSHEFKTPLTTIRLYAELLEQGRVRDETQRSDYLRTIGSETQRLARLVNNVLNFSRLEQGQKEFARAPLDLNVVLAALLDAHAPRVAEAGLVLRRELPSAALPLTTDHDAVAQIVLNLMENACKYAAAGGEVIVTLALRTGGGAILRVLDRGPGVPPEHRERIFEKFHRVDTALTAEKTGAGLGLAIARQLARGLGGELRCAPRVGGGAEFILELPA